MDSKNYDYWNEELDAQTRGFVPSIDIPKINAADTDRPISGFWRIMSAKTKPDYPVAIWDNAGAEMLRIGTSNATTGDPDELLQFRGSTWAKCAAVTEADYKRARDTGYWPDGKPARQISEQERHDIIPTTPASQGGNAAGADPEHEQIKTKLEALTEKAEKIGAIDSMTKAEEAAKIVEDMRSLGGMGETKRKAEKKPHDDAAQAVQDKWVPVLKPASDWVKALVDAIDGFKRREAARLQKEADDAAEAERQRVAKETADRMAAQGATEEEQAAAAEEAAAEVETTRVEAPKVATTFGRAVSKAKRYGGKITDKDAFIAAIKDQQDFIDFLQDKADKLARAKTVLAGMERVEL